MAASLGGVLSKNLCEKLCACKVLVVGAGGIGCELLKNLVLTGFQYIEVVNILSDILQPAGRSAVRRHCNFFAAVYEKGDTRNKASIHRAGVVYSPVTSVAKMAINRASPV